MKSFKVPALQIFAIFFICFIASCGTKPDLNKGLKVTLKLHFKEAIAGAANDPKDSMLITALNHVDSNQNSAERFIAAFIDQYAKQFPEYNVSDKFYPTLTDMNLQPASTKELKRYLLKIINDKRSKMAEVTAARIQAFCGTKQQDIKIDYKGVLMTIYIPGVTDEKNLRPVFSNRDGIRFWATMGVEELGSYIIRINDTLSAELKTRHKQHEVKKVDSSAEESLVELAEKGWFEKESASPLYEKMQLAVGADGKPLGASYIGIVAIKDTAKVSEYLQSKKAKYILPPNVQFMWGELPGKIQEGKKPMALYAIVAPPTGTPLVNSYDVKDAKADEYNGRVEISMAMTPPGTIKWARFTAERISKPIAIEVGNFVYSAPTVNDQITGGRSSITGDFNLKEAEDLAKIIKTGGFPIEFKIEKIELYENKKQ